VGTKNHVLDVGQDQMNPFADIRGNKTAMRPFAKLLCTLFLYATATATSLPEILQVKLADSATTEALGFLEQVFCWTDALPVTQSTMFIHAKCYTI